MITIYGKIKYILLAFHKISGTDLDMYIYLQATLIYVQYIYEIKIKLIYI